MKKLLIFIMSLFLGLQAFGQGSVYSEVLYLDKFDDIVKFDNVKTLVQKTDSTFVVETKGKKDIDWLVENLPDDDKKDPFDWRYFEFRCDLYCDYGPSTPLYLILVNAGVDKRDTGNICPWKTGIDIRTVDNAVIYNTYQHQEEL